jgi:hypothetical protein
MVDDQRAEIVDRVLRLSAEEAEDLDMFDLAAAGGGFLVYTRPPATAAEQDACRAEEQTHRLEQERAARRAMERRAAEEEARRQRAAARAEYEAWMEAQTAGLALCTIGIPLFDEELLREGEEIRFVPAEIGAFGCPERWTRIFWKGQPVGILRRYGNALAAYVLPPVRDEWCAHYWAEHQSPEHAAYVLTHEHLYAGCYGHDYWTWVIDRYGKEAVAEIARREVHRWHPSRMREREVEYLRSLGVDVRVLQPSREPGIYLDPVDGSRWRERPYRFEPI